MSNIAWQVWSIHELVKRFPAVLDEIGTHLKALPEDHQQKAHEAIDLFRTEPFREEDVGSDKRSEELATVGYVLDALARHLDQTVSIEDKLNLLQVAHETFRAFSHHTQPTKPMQQVMHNALRLIVNDGVDHIQHGEGDGSVLLEEVDAFITSARGSVTPQLTLYVNEMLLEALERVRVNGETDPSFHEKFVRDNIEAVLSLELPVRLEKILDTWIDIGEHIAPAAVRMAKRKFRRPEKLSELLPKELLGRLSAVVVQGEVEGLGKVLTEAENDLEGNLRLRLNAKAEYREPASKLFSKGASVDRSFEEARLLLSRREARALGKFKDLHFKFSSHTVVKEWYAYALTCFGKPTDIFEIIELLEDATKSKHYRPEFGWVAYWNLACALRKLAPRAKESLDVLLPVLDNDFHVPEAFELCLLWALEQDREDVLEKLLLKSPHYEAHLLAALYDARRFTPATGWEKFQRHFKRVGRFLQDPDHVFPDPAERLRENDFEKLTRGFIENSLVEAGVEWFRQRLSSAQERAFFKNWEGAALLNEKIPDLSAAWRCRENQWRCTKRSKLPNVSKGRSLLGILNWAERNGFLEPALKILRESWRETNLTEADVQKWEQRLHKTESRDRGNGTGANLPSIEGESIGAKTGWTQPSSAGRNEQAKTPDGYSRVTINSLPEAEAAIQELAGSFKAVSKVDALATKAHDVARLVAAVMFKHSSVPAEGVNAVREMLRIAELFHRGVGEEDSHKLAGEMRGQIEIMQLHSGRFPFEMSGLIEACERVSQGVSVRVKAVPDLSITPPADLKLVLDAPGAGERYKTCVCVRLANPAGEDMRNLTVAFSSPSDKVRFLANEIPFTHLEPQGKRLVECPVEICGPLENAAEIRIHVDYQIGSMRRTVQATGRVPVQTIGNPIPITERFQTGTPVSRDRKDLFHGRDREINDMLAAFSGGQLRKLYFVNGIRRVGKSSLITHLGTRCDADVLSILLNVENALGAKMTSASFVRELIRECIKVIGETPGLPATSLSVPSPDVFSLDPPWVVFDDYINKIQQQTGRSRILLCFDEMQKLVMHIADKDDPMDEGFLSWLRGKIQRNSNIMIICTGSEPYAFMRRRYEHTLWGNMEPYNLSFVDKIATNKIATQPVEADGVTWLPESLERLWDMTEGHPWAIQILAEKACERLIEERRRVVMPGDIDAAAELAAADGRLGAMWWNEENSPLGQNHRQVAFLILQNQAESRRGMLESQIGEICQRAGLRNVGKLLEEMSALEVLSGLSEGADVRWRIRGAFLERHLVTLRHRDEQSHGVIKPVQDDQPLALMLDWENVKISLSEHLKKRPTAEEKVLRSRLETSELIQRLLKAASVHGDPRQRWAVANWEGAFFREDQSKFKKPTRFSTDMSGDHKSDASDHVLREHIHGVLRDHAEITTFIIATGDGDFKEAIQTLRTQGKRVVLWAMRETMSEAFKYFLVGPDKITVEWLEDLIFAPE